MWLPRYSLDRKERLNVNGFVAVAIDKDKGSQGALKWAIDHLLRRGQTVFLVHVKLRSPSNSSLKMKSDPEAGVRELFLPFRCFCTRKDIQCKDVVLEDTDIAKALTEYAANTAIENIVVGASSKSGFLSRFKATDVPGNVSKGAPDFCNVFVISKGKIQSMRSASRPAPVVNPLRSQLVQQSSTKSIRSDYQFPQTTSARASLDKRPFVLPRGSQDEADFMRSPFTRKGYNYKPSYGDSSFQESDISYVSSGRPSIDRIFPSVYDSLDMGGRATPPRMSSSTDLDLTQSFESLPMGRLSMDMNFPSEFSSISQDSDRLSISSQSLEDVEAEMRRLKLELKQTMEMYSTACKEALTAKQKAVELQRWKLEEEQRIEEARLAGEAALALAKQEKTKSKAAIEAAEAARRIAELEAQKRMKAEMKAHKEAEEKKRAIDALSQSDIRYRKYTIEEIEEATEFFAESRKIGEGGYGPVYRCDLDHTPVAIKVLRPDATQGRSQFKQEVEVLSCIRHPNMVLLLGACPEYGCLVYEFMANGSLEDRLLQRGNTPPLSWQLRFQIAGEIGTALLFLHQTKPEPLVHRDLKPANILLDRNFVSKISDVGLARLVPPSVADNVTQYRMTSTAGTFCYIDPEYQQTGMLGVKSDIYSLGIMFLQLITSRPPMGLTHHVEQAIENDMFANILDPAITDWPIEEALSFAKMSLKCAELRRKDRPDLGKEILPELNRLRTIAEDYIHPTLMGDISPTRSSSQVSLQLVSLSLPLSFTSMSKTFSSDSRNYF
ncbi:U-box domain-containing protein 52-like isoform X1 [Cucurbita pepo subsp. pepo]|uniref:U-box domain-containing protein 52-like isoform X1 n=2 Tax=Cucurbita pepo subsp. pepo TaxID=3664 RepID=UPI000C9D8874|nr:U-box domain-containing protein 52-like isoform X1 [Cucurbita pepo subsp. pepo]